MEQEGLLYISDRNLKNGIASLKDSFVISHKTKHTFTV